MAPENDNTGSASPPRGCSARPSRWPSVLRVCRRVLIFVPGYVLLSSVTLGEHGFLFGVEKQTVTLFDVLAVFSFFGALTIYFVRGSELADREIDEAPNQKLGDVKPASGGTFTPTACSGEGGK